jgi:deazaflavin-dependent oxidoreductase (nitroreductase family)
MIIELIIVAGAILSRPGKRGISMSTSSQSDNSLRQMFKVLNRFMLLFWRLGLGGLINIWPPVIGRIMVITHRGRKSGRLRRTPVNYAVVNGDIYCTAGFGELSDWYRNIRADPHVEVWLPDGWWAGIAEEIDQQDPQWMPLLRQVLVASGFAAYAAGIDPHRISDAELEQVARNYRLLRIRRSEARTGPGGPGDLAWAWLLATMILLPLVLRRRKR